MDVADRNVWVEKGGHTYYIGEDGQFVTGYQEIEGSLYIFDGEGRPVSYTHLDVYKRQAVSAA